MPYCSFPKCNHRSRSSKQELCEGHYYQRRRGTDLRPLTITRFHKPVPVCSVDACETEAVSHYVTMCIKHNARVKRHGDPQALKFHIMKDSDNPNWKGDDVSYGAVHCRLRTRRGPASQHPCSECGNPAAQWAYDRDCPNERYSKLGPYSTDLSSYQPMCVSCHKLFDLSHLASA